jgi:parvulin-like peptidyl-prolyl isomerase
MDQKGIPAPKPSRQQRRAQSREKRGAEGWITALDAQDPGLVRSIRAAIGARHVTRGELEDALGMSLADASPAHESPPSSPRAEPERITVQHILISFGGAGTSATRTREAAAQLAAETLERARQGEDFGELVRALTDDAFPGIYRMCNAGLSPLAADEYPRGGMVPAFGNIGFALDVGGIAMAPFDPGTSPYGWHIIKRLA